MCMGKRSMVFDRFEESYHRLWEEAIKDIVRDINNYLINNPDIKEVKRTVRFTHGPGTVRFFSIGEGGQLLVYCSNFPDLDRYEFYKDIPYVPGNDSIDKFVFNSCIKTKFIIENVLSEESRIDIKLISDRYFKSIEELYEIGGLTKLKHLYKYLQYPVSWNLRDATIDKIKVKGLVYIYDSQYKPILLFGDWLLESKTYLVSLSYFQNRSKKSACVSVTINLDGFKTWL